ncbi:helix-turn-helix transcriptional regulator [Streptomyces sp. M19]
MSTPWSASASGLRAAQGWSLDELAARCYLSPSTLSRIETGHRRISLDQLSAIARALGTSIDQLVESVSDEDVVIRPRHHAERGVTTWMLRQEPGPHGVTVAKMRLTRPAPGAAPTR